MPDDPPSSARYSAFISYSSADAKFAAWLHRELESYRLPPHLAEQGGLRGGRLKPLFHDTWEMNAHHDLPQALREAIAESESMIVICSPAAKASEWVGREIELFRALHGDSPVRAALIEGAPAEAFPPALLADQGAEPAAADFRRGGSARKLAVLKLVAALAGVQLDELVQRDGQRRTRRVLAASAAAMAATVVISVLSVVAITSHAAEERQRARAEGLNEAMLTDVRASLKRSGRLDLLQTVNQAVDGYYRDTDDLTETAQAQRAQLMRAMGEDDEKRGDLASAQARFAQAHVITADLLTARPDDPQRLFDHAQSAYFLGFIAWETGDGEGARRGFQAYDTLARRLAAKDPGNTDWQMEVAYAESNLGLLALRQAGDTRTAQTRFASALARFQRVAEARPADADVQFELSDAHAWVAESLRVTDDLAGARAHRLAQRRILEGLLAIDRRNVAARIDLLSNQLAMARLDASSGRPAEAVAALDRGQADAKALLEISPGNRELVTQLRAFELFKVRTQLSMPGNQRPANGALLAALGDCTTTGVGEAEREMARFCQVLRARTLAAAGDRPAASRLLAGARPRRGGDVLSGRWGLDFAQEIRLAGG
ncbi:toll/interleukin-1 receptor domain-containing protein [uncultured Phenylobacterium sp.]|uniref:toll/interleukin-1 receptor domain-containing protein n=1 Tax=uncultured Phenylobacterium sp. TaxID=349273 RepID=UPI0025DE31BB|nr:toll/interleukin-1 receptor domain-containing protein [uncultured Phenylobacterium sp.]